MNAVDLLRFELRTEHDVAFVRQRARQVAALTGFDAQDQVRVATAVSEIARNAYQYAGGGRATFSITRENPQALRIAIGDRGPGIANLGEILSGAYSSKTGMGVGIAGAKRLMDRLEVAPNLGERGVTVLIEKRFPKTAVMLTMPQIQDIVAKLAQSSPPSQLEEIHLQNRALYEALEQLQEKQTELEAVNQELEETNRGVVALYTELDEKATALRRASEAKTAFLSNMTHEFRSPLNSILNISALLTDEREGVRDPDHRRQIGYIRKSATALSVLVNDLLDLAKVEAGRITVRPTDFTIEELFGVLRGLMKPLLAPGADVQLHFEDASRLPPLSTDEGKLSQILRNLISNALKYTERGEVRVRARAAEEDRICISVSDTGIGIAPEDQDRVFEEFIQIDSELQRRAKGTGLGLPLASRLAALLGGRIELTSELGQGSEFRITVDRVYRGRTEVDYLTEPEGAKEDFAHPQGRAILVIDDQPAERQAIGAVLRQLGYESIDAESGRAGIRLAREYRPIAIILDLIMPELDGLQTLKALLSDQRTRDIPVIVNTSKDLDDEERRYFSEIGVPLLSKSRRSLEEARSVVRGALEKAGIESPSATEEPTL